MNSDVWDSLIQIQKSLEEKFDETGTETFEEHMSRFNKDGWINKTWASKSYRRAHLEIVDARADRGLWVMHCCIFPHFHNNAPIFGLDVVAGKSKITGFFHDYSPTLDLSHPMIEKFKGIAAEYTWAKKRDLPEWAKAIFTGDMIAAGNITSKQEIDQILDICDISTQVFLDNIGKFNNTADDKHIIETHNRYSKYQKENPHTPKALKSLGLNPDDVDFFVDSILFPEF